LPDDAAAPGAERGAYGHLALAHGRAREEHVRHVAARDEHQQANRGEQRVEHRPEAADDGIDHVDDAQAEVRRVVGRELSGAARGEGRELRLGLLERGAACEPRLEVPPVVQRSGSRLRHRPGNPDVRRMPRETCRHHRHDRPRLPVENHGAADDARIAAEETDPRAMPEDGDRRRVRNDIRGGDGAAEKRRQAHELEEVGRDRDAADVLTLIAHHQEHAGASRADDILEDGALIAVGEELGNVEELAGPADRIVHGHVHEPIGIRIGERIQQDVVDDAVDDGRCADAEGEGPDREGGEARRPAQRPNGMPEVAPGVLEPDERTRVPMDIPDEGAGQLTARGSGRFIRGQPTIPVPLFGESAHGVELAREVPVGSSGLQEGQAAGGESAQTGNHVGSWSSLSTRPASRRHRSTCCSSARWPGLVMA
jgi:hypothetical protein